MNTKLPRLALQFLVFVLGASAAVAGPAAGSADTQVLKWKDGKQAVIILSFDDAAPSQLKNVIPELEKRKLVGTFYLVTGTGTYLGKKTQWEEAAKSPSVVVANHTFTHKGVKSVEELEPELAKCNEVLNALQPASRQPRLFAFGRPGGVPWEITEEQQQAGLAKNHLINRPSFFGPPIHLKSAEDVLAVVDKALARGEMGHLDMHGVGGDWLVTPMDWFLPLLDKLAAARDTIWSTDTLTWHKYVTERDSAAVEVLEAKPDRIRLGLSSKADPALYDEPLTLATKVPASWKSCEIVQGTQKTAAEVREGEVRYAALPGGGEIAITPAAK